jgi:hypothetical protein
MTETSKLVNWSRIPARPAYIVRCLRKVMLESAGNYEAGSKSIKTEHVRSRVL